MALCTVNVQQIFGFIIPLQALEKIITQVMQKVGKPLVDNITEAIATTYGDLNTKLEETALARPKQLGEYISIKSLSVYCTDFSLFNIFNN